MRLAVLAATLAWLGTALALSGLRWCARPALVERLRPYVATATGSSTSARPLLSGASFRDVIGPLASQVGERLARLLGPADPLALRLARVHLPTDVAAFRTRQLGQAGLGLLVGVALASASRPGPAIVTPCLVGGPLLGFLVAEQRLASTTRRWRERATLELPVVAEQLGMLLGAGFSLGAALGRLGERGDGVIAADLRRVGGRMRQGLSEAQALREWADLADIAPITRLVDVLALDREAADLGRLVSEEARTIRADAHRRMLEQLERRGQQVWVPVTVAALVPGVLFLAVPFLEAVRLFAG